MKLSEYFFLNRYQAKYEFGERVEGKFNKIPFVGSVGTDSVRNDDEEPHVTVTLDLPLVHKNKTYTVIRVPTKSVKKRKEN